MEIPHRSEFINASFSCLAASAGSEEGAGVASGAAGSAGIGSAGVTGASVVVVVGVITSGTITAGFGSMFSGKSNSFEKLGGQFLCELMSSKWA